MTSVKTLFLVSRVSESATVSSSLRNNSSSEAFKIESNPINVVLLYLFFFGSCPSNNALTNHPVLSVFSWFNLVPIYSKGVHSPAVSAVVPVPVDLYIKNLLPLAKTSISNLPSISNLSSPNLHLESSDKTSIASSSDPNLTISSVAEFTESASSN